MYRNSGSPADSDILGVLEYEGRNDNSEDIRYVQITSFADDVSDGTEDGSYFINPNALIRNSCQNAFEYASSIYNTNTRQSILAILSLRNSSVTEIKKTLE